MTASAPPTVGFRLPHPELRPYVTSYYFADSAGPLHDNLHPEWGNVRFVLRGDWRIEKAQRMTPAPVSALYGPTDRTARFTTATGALLGIGLTPLGWVRMIRSDASRLANAMVPLGNNLGGAGDELARALAIDTDAQSRADMLNATLLARLATAPVDDAGVIAVQDALLDDTIADVRGLALRVAFAERTLHRLCLRAFGFGPKRLLRRQRFLRTLSKIRDRLDRPLIGLLYDGYCDQAHFRRDFQSCMGMSPTAYFGSPREVMRRAAQERARVVGAPLQGLHRKA
ncbi:MAG: helix-turn-helix domain-containing protein [Sphingomonadaceae bacterium]|nr:helix-turn-helix domain-containing protein [Sphingomonadaceae bacterium]